MDALDRELAGLACPRCRGHLTRAGGDTACGILRCSCNEYPIIDGIPILKAQSATHRITRAELVALIRRGRHDDAVRTAICPPPPSNVGVSPRWTEWLPELRGVWRLKRFCDERARRRWMNRAGDFILGHQNGSADEEFAFFRDDSGFAPATWDYFRFRYGQPRHLVALSCLGVMRAAAGSGPVLEVACGCGHLTASALCGIRDRRLVAVDTVFYFLHLAKRRFAPDALYVCCDVADGLPFRDGTFSAVFCADAVHYFSDKARLFSEARRVATVDGLILGISIRNALTPQLYPCLPASPAECKTFFDGVSYRVVSDTSILDRYLEGLGPALACSSPPDLLHGSQLFSVVASRRPHVFRDHGAFDDWPHAAGMLRLNPLYEMTRRENGSVQLSKRTPSPSFDRENEESERYLPRTLAVTPRTLRHVTERRRTAEVEALIKACVVIGGPEDRDGVGRLR